MKKFSVLILLVIITTLLSTACETSSSRNLSRTELTISAAASLTDALTEIKASFEQDYHNVKLALNFSSSGKLAQQIEQGAPVDVFISANQKFMDQIQTEGLIDKSSRKDLVRNNLVLVASKNNANHINSFLQLGDTSISQITIGEPESVPAGKYAKEVFETLKLWNQLQHKLVYGKDVRQVLAYVESGNIDYGVVYSSDALISDKIMIVATANQDWHSPIIYPGAITTSSQHSETSKLFLDYLSKKKTKLIFKKYGFN